MFDSLRCWATHVRHCVNWNSVSIVSANTVSEVQAAKIRDDKCWNTRQSSASIKFTSNRKYLIWMCLFSLCSFSRMNHAPFSVLRTARQSSEWKFEYDLISWLSFNRSFIIVANISEMVNSCTASNLGSPPYCTSPFDSSAVFNWAVIDHRNGICEAIK